jgi:DNA-binding transcriptional MerR regulator
MAEYTTNQLREALAKTGWRPSVSTLIRWEDAGVFPPPQRRTRNKARVWTDEHLQKIKEYRDRTEAPPEPKKKAKKRKARRPTR